MDAGLVHALKVRLVDHHGVGAGVADHEVVQVSTIAAVLDRKYDGDVTIGEILASGDQGLGTLNGLDGELIIVDGEAWQGGADGVVRRVGEEEKTPFAVSTRFRADAEVEGDSMRCSRAELSMSRRMPEGETLEPFRVPRAARSRARMGSVGTNGGGAARARWRR